MAWVQSDLDAIEKAIAKGVRKVKYKDYEAEYNSLDQMLRVRSMIREHLGQGTSTDEKYTQFITSKGL